VPKPSRNMPIRDAGGHSSGLLAISSFLPRDSDQSLSSDTCSVPCKIYLTLFTIHVLRARAISFFLPSLPREMNDNE